MAILGALSIGRSGLVATKDALAVTANNIANVNTIAFKGSRAEFADLLAAQAGGSVSVGLGVRLAATSAAFTQGSIENTGRATDLAIEGNGFFVVRDGDGQLFTRAGNFRIDDNGFLVNSTDLPVQGFELDAAGQPIGGATDISFAGISSTAVPTTNIAFQNNLQADAPVIAGGFVSTSFDEANASANFTTTVKVYDSLGASHSLVCYFTKTGAGAWDVNIGVDAGEVGGTAGTLQILGTMSLTFDTDGSLTGPTPTALPAVTFDGASAQTITLDFGTPTAAPGDGLGRDGIVQMATASNVAGAGDGFAAGQLSAIAVDTEGNVVGIFDNGQSRSLYRVVLADFPAPDRLESLGDSLFRETLDSGVAAIGTPGAGGLGRVISQSVERSNVDLAQEFIDLISLQRSFQANSRVITTSDGLLNELINIVR